MKKALVIAGILALSITPSVWSKGDNALPPSPVWEEEMMLIAEDPLVEEMRRMEEEKLKRDLEPLDLPSDSPFCESDVCLD